MSNSKSHQLNIYFLPTMAPGHMIPMIDMARQFSRLGAKSTIITTPLNASQFSQSVERDRKHGFDISIFLVDFPFRESGLPEGCENLSSITTAEMTLNLVRAMELLERPVENLLQQCRPDCFIAGAYFWWASDMALKLNIPRLVFYGTGSFPTCIYRTLKEHKTHESVESDSEEFVVPGIPDVVRLSRKQLPELLKEAEKSPLADIAEKVLRSEAISYGVIANSFYELEPGYARNFKEITGKKVWNIGPVSGFNKTDEDKTQRGMGAASKSSHDCLSWLNSKKPNSVVYICFGSMAIFSRDQLLEIAMGLENSGLDFIWVVREKVGNEIDWLPEGFEQRIQGRGLIIRGWAPQVLILDHEAVGGFVTHCGWNSLIEGVAAGVPMVTWPLSAEQFFNEKLVVEILKTGVPVGAEEWTNRTDEREAIKREKIERAVTELMGGEEAERMRSRATTLGQMAKSSVEEGGSSHNDLKSLLEEIRNYSP